MINESSVFIHHNIMSYGYSSLSVDNENTTRKPVLSTILQVTGIITLIVFMVMTIIIATVVVRTYNDVSPLIRKVGIDLDTTLSMFDSRSKQIVEDSNNITLSIYLIQRDIDNITTVLNRVSTEGLNIARVGSEYIKRMADDLDKIARRIG